MIAFPKIAKTSRAFRGSTVPIALRWDRSVVVVQKALKGTELTVQKLLLDVPYSLVSVIFPALKRMGSYSVMPVLTEWSEMGLTVNLYPVTTRLAIPESTVFRLMKAVLSVALVLNL